jgi:hypothetical protein
MVFFQQQIRLTHFVVDFSRNSFSEEVVSEGLIVDLMGMMKDQNARDEQAKARRPKVSMPSPTPLPGVKTPTNQDLCRLFLAQLGLLDNSGKQRLQAMENNPRFLRSLKELDSFHGREVMKVGVVYVGRGQQDPIAILKNQRGSPLYEEFLTGIGWKVSLDSHGGFLGGLDRSWGSSYYYSNPTVEVMYHVATCMPQNPIDAKILEKVLTYLFLFRFRLLLT